MQCFDAEKTKGLTFKTESHFSGSRNGIIGIIGNSNLGKARSLNRPVKGVGINFFETLKHKIVYNELKLYHKNREPKSNLLILFLIDSSGSMAQNNQIGLIKGMVEEAVVKNSGKKVKFGMVVLREGTAFIECKPTSNQKDFLSILLSLQTGGKTCMSEGVLLVEELIKSYLRRTKDSATHLYIFTDGKFNQGSKDPFYDAVNQFNTGVSSLTEKVEVIDTEVGFVKLKMAQKFASSINVKYKTLDSLVN